LDKKFKVPVEGLDAIPVAEEITKMKEKKKLEKAKGPYMAVSDSEGEDDGEIYEDREKKEGIWETMT